MRNGLVWMVLAVCTVFGAAGDRVQLYRYEFDIDQGEPAVPASLAYRPEDRQHAYEYKLVHLIEPMKPETGALLEAAGAEILSYIPQNTFVVRVEDAAALADLAILDWIGDYHPAYKIHPDIGNSTFSSAARSSQGFVLHLTFHPGSDLNLNRGSVEALGGEILEEVDADPLKRFEVRFPDGQVVSDLARLDDIAWISEKGERLARNDRARWIVQSYEGPGSLLEATPGYDRGLHGEGEIVGLIDGRIDLGHCFFEDSAVMDPGPGHRKIVYFNSLAFPSAHGTHVAGTIAGVPESGDLTEAGVAYEARLAFTNSLGNQSGQLFNTLGTHALNGAFIHSNSWGEIDGSPVATDYTTDCVDIDTFMYQNEDQLVLFASMNDSTFPLGPLLSPENAVNVLAVGATEMGKVASPELRSERHGSCRTGPTVVDGRRKPEVFSPGCSIFSSSVSGSCNTGPSCGTSMATPVTAGVLAMMRQYFREGFYPTGDPVPGDEILPSGALLKAVLLNGTVNMLEETETSPGVYADLPVPNDVEGWGRTNLDRSLYFSGDCLKLLVEDVANADGLTTGQHVDFQYEVLTDLEPFRCTMVFTAPPGMVGSSNPVVNDLNVQVSAPDGSQYWGNVWTGGFSVTGGSPDAINNVEQVLIPVPQPGTYQVRISGQAVNMGIQGFALAVTGDLALDCEDLNVEAGPDTSLDCWGESVALGGFDFCFPPGSVSWSPPTGLSDPNQLHPMATPTQTTTYTLTVLYNGCMKTDQVTVTVPDMDIDQNQVLDQDDLYAFYGSGIWGFAAVDAAETKDYNANGRIDVGDIVRLVNCVDAAP